LLAIVLIALSRPYIFIVAIEAVGGLLAGSLTLSPAALWHPTRDQSDRVQELPGHGIV
jgi:hypothetical protein